MEAIHFLNVNEGDCILIEHPTGHKTVIDICNGNSTKLIQEDNGIKGNFNQKNNPVNPVDYIKNKTEIIFRFILSHPDMDHMDGIRDLFANVKVINFWDIENDKKLNFGENTGKYKKYDWDFYQEMRIEKSPKVLYLYAGQKGQYFNLSEAGKGNGDRLYILSPTEELVKEANERKEFNDCSYVILYITKNNKKIIFAGDSGSKTWELIVKNNKESVSNIDILVAPHHGHKSGGDDNYLDVLKPKLTLFGNTAKSKDFDYASWKNRGLPIITNNQAGSIIMDASNDNEIKIYVTNETFAKKVNHQAEYSHQFGGWLIGKI